MELSVLDREISISEQEKLNLPDRRRANCERKSLLPVAPIGDCRINPSDCRRIHALGLVAPAGGIENNGHANEVDTDSVIDRCTFVVEDGDDDDSWFGGR